MNHLTLKQAYLIHARDFRESSLLIDFFTKEQGFIKAVARGVRSVNKSNKRGLLQPFAPLLINWYGNADIVTLTTIELFSAPLVFARHGLAVSFYINELLYYILNKFNGVAMPELWDSYHQLLHYICDSNIDSENYNNLLMQMKLREFELDLLDYIGYGLQFEHIKADLYYSYHYENGFFEINNITDNNKIFIMNGNIILDIKNRNWQNPDALLVANKLLKLVIKYHIGNKEFNSRKLYLVD
jgi:DNA repair protein RecO (recombination protein O)